MVAVKCQYERKTRKPNETATEKDLQQFNFTEQPIPSASPIASPTVKPLASSNLRRSVSPPETVMSRPEDKTASTRSERSNITSTEITPTKAPPSVPHRKEIQVLTKENAELHLFDFENGAFLLQDSSVVATVSEVGTWQYWLHIASNKRDWLGQPVVADINPVFNFEYLSCIFVHYTDDSSAYSWLLRFKDQDTLGRFQTGLMQALWEQLNETKWHKSTEDDRQYILDAFQDLSMEDKAIEGEEEEEVEEIEDDSQRSEHYDTDESEDDVFVKDDDGNFNSQLAVGYKHDRSFVVRGPKIGVFKHTPNNNLEFSTNISKVETPGGKLFSPKKVMLHAEDANLILQNESNPHSLYRMDLEYGKVVDEWKVHDDIAVKTFVPDKVSQTAPVFIFLI